VLIAIDGGKFDEERFSRLLRAYFSSSEVEEEGKGYKRLRVSRGPTEARLCVAVMGARSIEDVEASLIREHYGDQSRSVGLEDSLLDVPRDLGQSSPRSLEEDLARPSTLPAGKASHL